MSPISFKIYFSDNCQLSVVPDDIFCVFSFQFQYFGWCNPQIIHVNNTETVKTRINRALRMAFLVGWYAFGLFACGFCTF